MKKLLLIGLRWHDYTKEIASELERQGYAVTYHEIQPRTLFYKALRVLAPALFQQRLDRHHASILAAEVDNRYDVVLFIQAHQYSVKNIEALRRQHAGAKFVLYNWDAITTHDYRPQMHVFDSVYTFDPDDAKALNINYLPLFCVRAFQNLEKKNQNENAIYFVGNIVNVGRYVVLREFKKFCRREHVCFRAFMACSPVKFVKLLRADIIPFDISFFYIRQKKLVEMIERSTAVFDFANHQQSGYTMRVIENLCAGKKLITNNRRIVHEPFYSADRILVFENMDFSDVKEFMNRKLTSSDAVFERFHIQNFVEQLLR